MNRFDPKRGLPLAVLLVACGAGAAAGEQAKLLWQIGKADNDTREFALQQKVSADCKTLDLRPVVRTPGAERQPVDWVDCLLGTSTSRWMLYPGPSTPFSMVKLSPDNQRQPWKGGYEYMINNIAGFSHLHSWTMGGLLTMPTTGSLKVVPGTERDPDAGYRSRFSHQREKASPGYYAVTLDDYGS